MDEMIKVFPSGKETTSLLASANEIEKLYGQIEGGVCHCAIEDEIIDLRETDPLAVGHPRHGVRIVEVKNAFAKAFRHLGEQSHKPVNTPLVDDVKLFFKRATLFGIESTDELARKLEVSGLKSDHIRTMSSLAMAQNASNTKRKAIGLELRLARKGWR